MTLNARAKAFRDLRAAIAALMPHLDPKAAALLADLADKVQNMDLPPAPDRVRDASADDAPDRLRHLLTLAGPDIAPKLLQQLVLDLIQCRDDIAGAMAEYDWKAMRNGSHVLISLAGSVGAVSLQSLAERLNAAAHRQDRVTATRLLPQVLVEIGTLTRLIEATPPVADPSRTIG